MYKILAVDRSTWKQTSVCKLFVLGRNTWYHNYCKKSQETITQKM